MSKKDSIPLTVIPADDCVIGTHLAAQISNVSDWTMGQLIRRGQGPRIVRLCGRKIGIRMHDLKDWIASKEVSRAANPQ